MRRAMWLVSISMVLAAAQASSPDRAASSYSFTLKATEERKFKFQPLEHCVWKTLGVGCTAPGCLAGVNEIGGAAGPIGGRLPEDSNYDLIIAWPAQAFQARAECHAPSCDLTFRQVVGTTATHHLGAGESIEIPMEEIVTVSISRTARQPR